MRRKIETKYLSVEWGFSLKNTLQQNFSNRQWAKLSENVISQDILPLVTRGVSPVAGGRKLVKYSERYKTAIKKGLLPGKTVSPVSLTLTGSMLSNYKSKAGEDTFSISVGIHKDAPDFDRLKAEVHNNGNEKTPRRPFVPLAGEQFTRKITLEIRKLFAYCLDQALNRRKAK